MRRRGRIDNTQTALVELGRRMGGTFLPWPNGPIDGIWLLRDGRVRLVDYKSPRGKLTERQEALIKAGWPLNVVRDEQEQIGVLT